MFQKDGAGTIGFTGVCWKLSKATGINANFFRAAFVAGAFATKAVIGVYVALWLLFLLVEQA